MTDCKLIRESLGRWLDGELGGSDAEAIRVHLESCAACDVRATAVGKTASLLERSFGVGCATDCLRAFLEWGPGTDYDKAELA